jgi:hypothetical protein
MNFQLILLTAESGFVSIHGICNNIRKIRPEIAFQDHVGKKARYTNNVIL